MINIHTAIIENKEKKRKKNLEKKLARTGLEHPTMKQKICSDLRRCQLCHEDTCRWQDVMACYTKMVVCNKYNGFYTCLY